MNNQDYARIHDMIGQEMYLEAAKELLKQSPAAVADFTRSFIRDNDPTKMRKVIARMLLLEKQPC